MKDYTINKDIPLTDVQNEVIDFLRTRPRAINASATGLGKCVLGSTRVQTALGYKRISDLHKNKQDGAEPFNILVSTRYGERNSIAFYQESDCKVNLLKLSNGMTINGTDDHRVLVLNNDGFPELIKISEICVGDHVLLSMEKTHWDSSAKVDIDDRTLYLIGLWLGDGSSMITRYGISYTIEGEKDIIEYVADDRFSGIHFTKNNTYRIVGRKGVNTYLTSLGLGHFNSYQKFIPEVIFESSREQKLRFLWGLIDSDGTFSNKVLEWVCASKKLIKDLGELLQSLGVSYRVSTKTLNTGKYKDNTYYRLRVLSRSYPVFLEINHFSRKYQALKEFCSSCNNINKTDYVVLTDSWFKTHEPWLKEHSNGIWQSLRIGRRRFTCERLIKENCYIAYELMKYEFVKVVSKNTIIDTVYDLEVSDVHEFMAQGLANHNTYTTLTIAIHFMTKHPEYKCIILCPAKANKAFVRELTTKVFERYSMYTADKEVEDPKARFFIFNYSSLHKYFQKILSIKGNGQIFFLVDESHNLQNPESQLYKAARGVLSLGKIRWFMTATPLGNDLEGFYWMMDLLNPGCLHTIDWFKNRYEIIHTRPTQRGGRKFNIPEVVGYRNLAELKAFASNYIIIRKIVYDLKFYYRSVEAEPLVMELYKKAARGLSYDTEDKNGNAITAIRGHGARLHDLQKVLDNCHPDLGGTTFSNKEKELCRLIIEKMKAKESLLIYCDYYDTIDRVEYVISKLQAKLGVAKIFKITGKQPPKERAKVEDQMVPCSIVIVSSAGCESINLQKANNVCFYDIPFAINDVIQMVGRVARMDSKFSTMSVYFIEYKGTIDTYKKELIQKHSTLIDSILCHETNLPTEVLEIDARTSRDMKNKYLWK